MFCTVHERVAHRTHIVLRLLLLLIIAIIIIIVIIVPSVDRRSAGSCYVTALPYENDRVHGATGDRQFVTTIAPRYARICYIRGGINARRPLRPPPGGPRRFSVRTALRDRQRTATSC
jgi:hypothetical protein